MYIIQSKTHLRTTQVGQTVSLKDAVILACLVAKIGSPIQQKGIIFDSYDDYWFFELSTEYHKLKITSPDKYGIRDVQTIIDEIEALDASSYQEMFEKYKARCPNPVGPPIKHSRDKKTEVIRFRLTDEEHRKIKAVCLEDESPHQCAKRLLFSLLDDPQN